ncbi:MAG: TetR/AcrR family transcriptional regulator [Candidatus Heimdallarchaeota archaeon]
MQSSNKREAKKEQTREKILEAAMELFYNYGFSEVSTEMIAEKAGVSKGGLFHHFSTKETLGIMVLRKSFDAFKEYLPYIDQLDVVDYKPILKMVLEEIIKMSLDQPGFIRMLLWYVMRIEDSMQNENLRELIMDTFQESFKPYLKAFEIILQKVGHKDASLKSLLLLGMLDGVSIYLSYLKKVDEIEPSLNIKMDDYNKIPDIIMELFFSKDSIK